jgi:hypothetical protein
MHEGLLGFGEVKFWSVGTAILKLRNACCINPLKR